MSDSSFSDDELLSSHLDGELTVDDDTLLRVRLRAEPTLQSRLEELRAATELSATPVARLRTGDADRLMGAALAASATTESVTDLGAVRMRRNKWRTRLVTVAAGVAALAVTVPVLRSITADDADTVSVTADSDEDSAADDGGEDEAGANATTEADSPDSDMADEFLEDLAMESSDSDDSGEMDDDEADPAGAVETAAYAERGLNANLSRLGSADPAFDPLPDELGEFTDEGSLVVALGDAADVALSRVDEEPVPTTIDGEFDPELPPDDEADGAPLNDLDDDARSVLRDGAAKRLDGFGGCGSAIDEVLELLSEFPPVLAVDWSAAQLGGDAITVGLFLLPDNEVFAVIIDPVTCTTTDRLLFP